MSTRSRGAHVRCRSLVEALPPGAQSVPHHPCPRGGGASGRNTDPHPPHRGPSLSRRPWPCVVSGHQPCDLHGGPGSLTALPLCSRRGRVCSRDASLRRPAVLRERQRLVRVRRCLGSGPCGRATVWFCLLRNVEGGTHEVGACCRKTENSENLKSCFALRRWSAVCGHSSGGPSLLCWETGLRC